MRCVRSTDAKAMLVVAALLCVGAGCNFVGPRALRRGAVSYGEAVQYTTDQQLLLNIVRLRYRDNPSFMEVSAIATSYTLSHSASAGADVNDSSDLNRFDLRSISPSVSLGYDEKPTITYAPVRGEKFARQMLTPITPETLLLLYNSGWNISRLFRCCLLRLNQLPNAPGASGPTPEHAPEFAEFIKAARLLRQLQMRNRIYLVGAVKDGKTVIELHIDKKAAASAEAKELRRLLALRPGKIVYPLTNSLEAKESPDQIMIATRSIMGILYFLSQGVAVPAVDVTSGIVTDTRLPDGTPFDWVQVLEGVFTVKNGKPERSFLSVKHRGRVFYIDDRDLTSKATFMLITQIMALQSGGGKSVSPALTIPVR